MRAVMPCLADLFQFGIGDFIQELLDDLEIEDNYDSYAQTIPPSFRVRFASASTIVPFDRFSSGGRNNPIDLS